MVDIDNNKREKKYNLWGWVLFVICAFFFIASAVASGDMLYLVGSIIFLAACVVFIIPLVTGRGKGDKN